MKPSIHIEKEFESIFALGSAPCPAGQAFHVIADHRIAMIEGKYWIKSASFELALPDDTAASPIVGLVAGFREVFPDQQRVVLAFVGFYRQSFPRAGLELSENFLQAALPLAFSEAVFLPRNGCQMPFSGYASDS